MLRFFFGRSSRFVGFLEMAGLVQSLILLQLIHWQEGLELWEGFFLLLFAQYLFIRVCDLIAWYPRQGRGIGIEVHFKKALVPTSYILALSLFIVLAGFHLPILIVANLLTAVIATVNGILIWFYFYDKEELPVNYFSLNQHLQKKEPVKEAGRITEQRQSQSPA
ncbi:MAG: hypothetical protein Q7S98_06710 [Deltaproteobacteria bacterium]|nr:hypothetical protein [Deltaproteobacteria bacterium]